MTLIEELEKWKKGFDEVASYHNGDYKQGMERVLDGLSSQIHTLKRKESQNIVKTETDLKTYYAEISIDFLDISIDEDQPNADPYEGRKVDSFIIHSKNEEEAIKQTFEKSMKKFREDYNEKENVFKAFHIDVFYETSDDARSS